MNCLGNNAMGTFNKKWVQFWIVDISKDWNNREYS